MSDPAELVEIPVADQDYHWTNYVTAIKFGTDEADAWATEATKVFTDSGTSLVTISYRYWDWFI